MKCALCAHQGGFPEVGRTRGDNRRVYRCPRCKYDQAKNLFGTGQFLAPGREVDLRVPPQTSLVKRQYELRLVQAGVLSPKAVTESEHASSEQLAVEHMADAARDTPDMEWLGDVVARHGSAAFTGGDTGDDAGSSKRVPPWHRLAPNEQQSHQVRLIAALDDVLDDVVEGFAPETRGLVAASEDAFIQFSRVLLKACVDTYDTVRECGASHEELPFGQVLAGYPRAVENAVQHAPGGLSEEDRNVLHGIVSAVAVPLQAAVAQRIGDSVFVAIQRRVHPDIER